MLKEGHVHLSPKSNTQLSKISELRKSNFEQSKSKFDVVAELIEKEYKKTFKSEGK